MVKRSKLLGCSCRQAGWLAWWVDREAEGGGTSTAQPPRTASLLCAYFAVQCPPARRNCGVLQRSVSQFLSSLFVCLCHFLTVCVSVLFCSLLTPAFSHFALSLLTPPFLCLWLPLSSHTRSVIPRFQSTLPSLRPTAQLQG